MNYDPTKFTDGFIRETCNALVADGKMDHQGAEVMAEELRSWRDAKEKSLESIRMKIEAGKPLSFFVISALTHIETKREFAYNNEMINHVMIMLWNEFGFGSGSSALLTNESQLDVFPPEWRNPLTYSLDQRSVREADLIVSILSYPSQGLGQEAEHAKAHGVPIIGILQRTRLSKKRLDYTRFSFDGDMEEKVLYKGKGGSSTMVIGNPVLHESVTYPKNTLWTDFLQAVDNLGWRLQYWRKRGSIPYKVFKKLGKLLHPILEEMNPRTLGLRGLHAELCELGFVPESAKVKARLDELNAVPHEKLTGTEIAEIAEKTARLSRLRKLQNFHPIQRNKARMYYNARFPLETRIPGAAGSHTKIVMGVFMKPKGDGTQRTGDENSRKTPNKI